MEIKIPLVQILMETNHADSSFEFLSCAWSISSTYAEKNDFH